MPISANKLSLIRKHSPDFPSCSFSLQFRNVRSSQSIHTAKGFPTFLSVIVWNALITILKYQVTMLINNITESISCVPHCWKQQGRQSQVTCKQFLYQMQYICHLCSSFHPDHHINFHFVMNCYVQIKFLQLSIPCGMLLPQFPSWYDTIFLFKIIIIIGFEQWAAWTAQKPVLRERPEEKRVEFEGYNQVLP